MDKRNLNKSIWIFAILFAPIILLFKYVLKIKN